MSPNPLPATAYTQTHDTDIDTWYVHMYMIQTD